MPRRTPLCTGGLIFHVLNRGVRRLRLFDTPSDYQLFLDLFAEAQQRVPMRCLAYCLMPNHFHLILWPEEHGNLSRFMFWLQTKHARRWHWIRGTRGTGHVYQNRFKALPVCEGERHFLQVCRYVERNPRRAGLVEWSRDWRWSSLAQRNGRYQRLRLSDWPVERPELWEEMLDGPADTESQEIRQAIRRNRPFGPDLWREDMALQFGMRPGKRQRGRPRKSKPGFIFPAPEGAEK